MSRPAKPDVVTVRVAPGWAVHDGQRHRHGGELLDVDPDTATHWVAAGWVEAVTKPTTKRNTSSPTKRNTSSRRRGT